LGGWSVQNVRNKSVVTVTKDKWDKGKKLIESLWEQIVSAGVDIEGANLSMLMLYYKQLEITWGFLVHLSMIFDLLVHHLKGFHLALASYLPKRNDDRWKLSDADWTSYLMTKWLMGNVARRSGTSLFSFK
jgi:hypothetical protein